MFTLPVDRPIKRRPAISGKQIAPSTWKCRLMIEPGFLDGEIWTPVISEDHPGVVVYRCRILWGDRVLVNSTVIADSLEIVESLPDSEFDYTDLAIELTKMSSYPLIQKQSMLRISLWAENMDITRFFEQHGGYQIAHGQSKIAGEFMGETGRQFLKIHTPIYPWLMANRWLIQQNGQT